MFTLSFSDLYYPVFYVHSKHNVDERTVNNTTRTHLSCCVCIVNNRTRKGFEIVRGFIWPGGWLFDCVYGGLLVFFSGRPFVAFYMQNSMLSFACLHCFFSGVLRLLLRHEPYMSCGHKLSWRLRFGPPAPTRSALSGLEWP